MSEARLQPAIEAAALLRRAEVAGGFGAILHKGDPERGTILLVLLERGGGPLLLQRLLQRDGSYAWERRFFAESAELDRHVAKARANDCDLWVIELDVPSTERFIAEMT